LCLIFFTTVIAFRTFLAGVSFKPVAIIAVISLCRFLLNVFFRCISNTFDFACIPGTTLLAFPTHYMEWNLALKLAVIALHDHFLVGKIRGHLGSCVLRVKVTFKYFWVTHGFATDGTRNVCPTILCVALWVHGMTASNINSTVCRILHVLHTNWTLLFVPSLQTFVRLFSSNW